ncbi:hypothetical protein [Agrobacterium rubi]|uniref:Uncharacterized protein n=2 Tax=Agrobacterium rubi TaxID=28099 RepID=A0AAE7UTC7_9HYPH|nr:hypothetical protein [Agrobacterium rubi]NTE89526.1 hypothetical protein [Agrobacterium rubi]NTF05662.1 hypothetical protein [Agrobacterium rubi]NTF39662.1 hypothetical protein [Agrobacterium rubi]OCJ51006.1 hypothetical protein A6U92_04975 [Agrobacterium rubi]QTG03552.1 hypothetical protein G6M88_24200 [Agrobacterium rubi]
MHVELDPVFEKWWKSQGVINDRDKSKARVAFVAAYKLALKQKAKTYNFQAGRWTVTVLATSMKDAKILATAKLNERAEKLLAKPPAGGWGLRLVAEKAEENLR